MTHPLLISRRATAEPRHISRDQAIRLLRQANEHGKNRGSDNLDTFDYLPSGPYVIVRLPLSNLDYIREDSDRAEFYAGVPGEFPPVLGVFGQRRLRRVMEDGLQPQVDITNGNHRCRAAELRGEKTIQVIMAEAAYELYQNAARGRQAAAPFPSRSFSKLWHVGTMDRSKKRDGSHEGSGLSVSLNPEEWQRINPFTAGDIWELTKPGNRFLDYHRLTKKAKRDIADWAVKEGYAEPTTLYRVSWFDDEIEDTVAMDFTDRAEAEEEAGISAEMDPDGARSIEEIAGGVKATDKLRQATGNSRIDPVTVPDMLATVYVEEVLHWDGVWWNDRLDVSAYSAPRGVISNRMLPTWKAEKRHPKQAGKSGKERSASLMPKRAMNINVPEDQFEHFWEEPPPGNDEFWAFRFPPKAQPGDRVVFHMNKTPVAEAVISRVERPGQSECEHTGKFRNRWKVYWSPSSFRRLGESSPKSAGRASIRLSMYFPNVDDQSGKRASEGPEIPKEVFLDALGALNALLKNRKQRLTFLCVGGGAMMLLYGTRDRTQDLDGILSPDNTMQRELLQELAEEVAEDFRDQGRFALPPDWINMQVRPIMKEQGYRLSDFTESPEYHWSNLKLLFANPDKVLAMKCEALREGKKDYGDIASLLQILDIRTLEKLRETVSRHMDWNFIGNREVPLLKLAIAWAFPGQTEYDRYRVNLIEHSRRIKGRK